ncbi:MAG: hypothetical protein Q8S13_14715 [Dehalococcoidia bacterium]|nr:hypothetical protein [Dehalococcoidia bacterium]
MQRKFVRKKKGEVEAPSPIITFEDYNRAIAPIDLYRKHYLMFEYWNTELQRELEGRVVNPKRVRLASEESLTELGALQRLLTEEAGAELAPVIEERRAVDRQLRDKGMNRYQGQIVKKTIDAHGRLMNGRFFWRSVKDQLKPREGAGPDAVIPPSGSPATP